MILLILYAFIAGVVTLLSPCILPLLPIILSSSDSSGKQKPFGVVVGFIASFTFFTLFLSLLVKKLGFSADVLRVSSIVILIIFGLSLMSTFIQTKLEYFFSKIANKANPARNKSGFIGGFLIGISLGLLWSPCVGPILATVISLAVTGTVTAQTLIITLAYATGTGLPMLIIMLLGSDALKKFPLLTRNTSKIQKIFGFLMVLTALSIFFNLDRKFQRWVLSTFPNYGVGLTKFENNIKVDEAIQNNIQQKNVVKDNETKTTDNLQPKGPEAPQLYVGGEWINSEALSMNELKGKVVLVDFWTYTCINCQRTLPYVKEWWDKYKDKGLVIIGVHTPEFEFEKNPNNVKQAVKDFGITYPVMQDNNYVTWSVYNNHYWPAKYLIDKNGEVRYTHFGEGNYNETERMIQQLLKEIDNNEITQKISNPTYSIYARTPETYLGSARMEFNTSPERISPNIFKTYSVPTSIPNNRFAYNGEWLIKDEYAAPKKGSKLLINFNAKNVYLVSRPNGNTCSYKINLDTSDTYYGEDVNNGVVTVDKDRLYRLINLKDPGNHLLTIEFLDDSCEVFAFTFG